MKVYYKYCEGTTGGDVWVSMIGFCCEVMSKRMLSSGDGFILRSIGEDSGLDFSGRRVKYCSSCGAKIKILEE